MWSVGTVHPKFYRRLRHSRAHHHRTVDTSGVRHSDAVSHCQSHSTDQIRLPANVVPGNELVRRQSAAASVREELENRLHGWERQARAESVSRSFCLVELYVRHLVELQRTIDGRSSHWLFSVRRISIVDVWKRVVRNAEQAAIRAEMDQSNGLHGLLSRVSTTAMPVSVSGQKQSAVHVHHRLGLIWRWSEMVWFGAKLRLNSSLGLTYFLHFTVSQLLVVCRWWTKRKQPEFRVEDERR